MTAVCFCHVTTSQRSVSLFHGAAAVLPLNTRPLCPKHPATLHRRSGRLEKENLALSKVCLVFFKKTGLAAPGSFPAGLSVQRVSIGAHAAVGWVRLGPGGGMDPVRS